MEKEEYRDVVGFEDYFQISNLGNVFSKRSNRILKQTKSKTGYLTFATKIGGRKGSSHCFRIHRLVAEAFIPNPEGKPFVNHIDGCKTNNILSNLEWVTASENTIHALDIGLIKTDSRSHAIRQFTVEEILYIRSSNLSHRKLGEIYGVHHSTIGYIKLRKTYKDIPDSPLSL